MKVLVDRKIEEDYIQFIVEKLKDEETKYNLVVYEYFQYIFENLDKIYERNIFTQLLELYGLSISSKVLLEVLQELLPKNSRYTFEIIPVEILGTICEQFLGKGV